jgi:hypothetical protein
MQWNNQRRLSHVLYCIVIHYYIACDSNFLYCKYFTKTVIFNVKLINLIFQSFIVRQSSQIGTMAVSVRQAEAPHVEHYLIQQNDQNGKLRLESSEHLFENILSLVYHYATVK